MLRCDATLQSDVIAELSADRFCRDLPLSTSVKQGIVTLNGCVPSEAVRSAVLCAVKRVYGVDGIDCRLEIGQPGLGAAIVASIGPEPGT